MNDINYKVYVRIDNSGHITAVNSSAFLTDTTGWLEIDEGSEWPKYMHAQGNYFSQSICTADGIPRYQLIDGEVSERSAEDIEADREEKREYSPISDSERIAQLEDVIASLLFGGD